jgi:hypothetical protein
MRKFGFGMIVGFMVFAFLSSSKAEPIVIETEVQIVYVKESYPDLRNDLVIEFELNEYARNAISELIYLSRHKYDERIPVARQLAEFQTKLIEVKENLDNGLIKR